MAAGEGKSGSLEWKINVSNGTTKVLEPERGLAGRVWQKVQSLIIMKAWKFLMDCWNIGVAEPTRFTHCLKVGLSLTVVSLLYYMRPLYDGIGKNAMWAIMTVVVVSEYTVGSTIYKSINRAVATTIAGSLGVGVHWVASHCDRVYQPIILGVSVFIFASVATFTRFIPTVKARFDYGAMIFILTFSLVSISGYRVDELVMLAQQRVSTIAIGISLCILVSMLFWPVWAGDKLHNQTISNLEKLAISLEGYIAEYFSTEEAAQIPQEVLNKKLQGYKCVLNSKTTEESMANLAIWEPAHGRFYFGYPWKQYLNIGAATRSCAYCIDNLNSCIDSKMQAPELLKKHINDKCTRLSFYCSEVLRELATAIKTRKRSYNIDLSVDKMIFEVEEFQNALKSLPCEFVLPLSTPENSIDKNGEKIENPNQATLLEVLPLGMLATLLIEIVARVEEVVQEVDKLADMAEFKIQKEKKLQDIQPSENNQTKNQGQETMKAIEEV
ncbi:hypothetical protein BVRB_1g002690 [Beta vulgaris subsp. vulgaris]|nr:hypothetical protein BVRB_1g002690 [Beta vulgaris subsp. vulgaris]